MRKLFNEDVAGQRFGRCAAIEREGRNWLFLCDCGNEFVAGLYEYRVGKRQDCASCRQSRKSAERPKRKRPPSVRPRVTHGHSRGAKMSPTYRVWSGMFTRCFNSKHHTYRYYGARGITICERWRKFENFLADMGERPDGLSIDRINNDGNYEPSNCRWATNKEQQANTRPKNKLKNITKLASRQAKIEWLLKHSRMWAGWPRGSTGSDTRLWEIVAAMKRDRLISNHTRAPHVALGSLINDARQLRQRSKQS